jgi:hypothetical protein
MSNFLEEAFKGKRRELRNLAVDVLNVYLTSPLSDRQQTNENRRSRLKKLIDDAIDSYRSTQKK